MLPLFIYSFLSICTFPQFIKVIFSFSAIKHASSYSIIILFDLYKSFIPNLGFLAKHGTEIASTSLGPLSS